VTFHVTRAELQTGYEVAQQLLGVAVDTEDPLLVALPHFAAGWTLILLGELNEARAHLEQVVSLYQLDRQRFLTSTHGQRLVVGSLSWASQALWLLGYPEQALKRSQEATSLAEQLEYPLYLAMAQTIAGCGLHALLRDVQATREWAEACISLSTQQGFPVFLSLATICHGWAMAEQGRVEEGIAQTRRGIESHRATGGDAGPLSMFLLLADMWGKAGRTREGLSILAEALERAHSGDERYAEAEIHRLWGELLLMEGMDEAEVEQHFLQAIEVAQRQQAKSWELRATVSLCRLWQRQGKVDEARKILARIYNWFTEGFDTADLKEAKVLLEELAGG